MYLLGQFLWAYSCIYAKTAGIYTRRFVLRGPVKHKRKR